jgi:hypothetical protein
MRAVLDQDYKTMKNEVLYEKIAFIDKHPHTQFATVFDYTGPRPTIKVVDVRELSDPGYAAPYHGEHVARAARSGGRMELHVAGMWDGKEVRPRLFPMRSNLPRLHDTLVRLSKDGTLGDLSGEDYNREALHKIEVLIARTDPGLVEIHQRCY